MGSLLLDYEHIKTELVGKDPILELVLTKYVPTESEPTQSDYVRLIRIIIGQQLSGAAAKTIFSRLIRLIGKNFTETDLLKLDDKDFSNIGISKAKTNYAKNISNYLLKNSDYFKNLKSLNSNEQIAKLIKFKGVGMWTASIFVMSNDLMSDVFALGDGTLNKVIKNLYHLPDENLEETIEKIASIWSPYRTLVCKALWHYNDNVLTQTRNRI